MKIICEKSNLLAGLSTVSKAVPNKTTNPILECIYLDASKGVISFSANNLELAIETIVEGEIEEPGFIALEAKILLDIVRKLPDNQVTIKTEKNCKTTITCEKAKFNIIGKVGDDFPAIPRLKVQNQVVISQMTLKDIVRQTLFSAATDDNNRIMTGELVEINEDVMRVIALDGHRISIRRVGLRNFYDYRKIVVPGKTLSEVTKILSGGANEDVVISFTENHILFNFESTTVVSRLIEGEYFNVDRMLSSDYETKMHINKKDLINCVERASLLVKEGDKRPIILNIKDGVAEFKVNSVLGSMNEEINIEKQGRDLMIGLNPKFFLDALKAIDEEEVDLYMINAKSPCFIKDVEGTYIYMVLPINFNTVD